MSRTVTTVGIIGLGAMGRPLASRLLHAGFDVIGHTRTSSTADSLIADGMAYVNSVAELTRRTESVLMMLSDEAASQQVSEQVLNGAQPGQCLIELSTISPALSKRIAQRARDAAIAYLEAPVSGGPAGAKNGTLTAMVGGDIETLNQVRPILESFSAQIKHCGPAGQGQGMKLINQLLVGLHTAAAAEAAVLARHLEIDLAMVEEVVGSSFGASAMLSRTLPRIANSDFHPATPVRLLAKDLGLVRSAAASAGVPLRLGALVEQLFLEASARGWGAEDMAGTVRLWPQRPQQS